MRFWMARWITSFLTYTAKQTGLPYFSFLGLFGTPYTHILKSMPEALKKGNCHNMFPLNQLGKLSNKNVVISSLNVFVGVMFLDFDSHCSGPWTEWKFGEWTFWVSNWVPLLYSLPEWKYFSYPPDGAVTGRSNILTMKIFFIDNIIYCTPPFCGAKHNIIQS